MRAQDRAAIRALMDHRKRLASEGAPSAPAVSAAPAVPSPDELPPLPAPPVEDDEISRLEAQLAALRAAKGR